MGILFGGAGAALAHDGAGIGRFAEGGSGFASHCAVAGVPSVYGTIFTASCSEEGWGGGPEFDYLGSH